MPADIFSNFGPGTATTQTGGAPGFGSGYGYGYGNFGLNTQYLNNLLGSQMAIHQARGDEAFAVKDAMAREQLKALQRANTPTDSPGATSNTVQQSQYDTLAAKNAQLEALTGRAPQKFNQGAGIVSGYSTDPEAMTGAQRQMFLPQNSHGYPSGDPGGGFGKPLPSPMNMNPGGPDTTPDTNPEQRFLQQSPGYMLDFLRRQMGQPSPQGDNPYASQGRG